MIFPGDRKFPVVGIDEAGRGPWAGPVSLAAVSVPREFDLNLDELRDSKKLSPIKREKWYLWLRKAKKEKRLDFEVALVGEKLIDNLGLSRAISLGLEKLITRLNPKPESHFFLDGGLYLPKKIKNQITIIKGDEKNPIIALASIAAKVSRDTKMISLSESWPQYGFRKNKGYGTAEHIEALDKHGPCPSHRFSFAPVKKRLKP